MKKGLLIYQRIILIQFISILAITTIFGFYLYKSNSSKEIKSLNIQTDQLKERLAANLSIPLWNFDSDSYDKLLMQEIKDKYISAIIINQDNQILTGILKSEEEETIKIDDISKYEDDLNKSYMQKKSGCHLSR